VAGGNTDRAGGVRARQGVARIRNPLLAPVLLSDDGRRSSRRPSSPAQPAATPVATRGQLRSRLRGGEGPVPNPGQRRRSSTASPPRRCTTRPHRGGLLGDYGVGGRLLGARKRGVRQANGGRGECTGQRRGACTPQKERSMGCWESGRGINEERDEF
jgi:hypothetical protein